MLTQSESHFAEAAEIGDATDDAMPALATIDSEARDAFDIRNSTLMLHAVVVHLHKPDGQVAAL